jgi:hypothetical protein
MDLVAGCGTAALLAGSVPKHIAAAAARAARTRARGRFTLGISALTQAILNYFCDQWY